MTDVDGDSEITVVSSNTTVKPTIPESVIEKLRAFNEALTSLEDAMKPHLEVPFEKHMERPVLDMARIDIMSMFTMSSLSWALTSMKGERPKDHLALTSELKRTKEYVTRFNTADERKKAPRLNTFAAKAFVRNALWDVPENNTKSSDEVMVYDSGSSSTQSNDADAMEETAEATSQ